MDIILDTVSKKEIKRIHVFDKSTQKQGSHYGAGENTVIVQDPKNYDKLKNLSKVVICAVSWKNEIRIWTPIWNTIFWLGPTTSRSKIYEEGPN